MYCAMTEMRRSAGGAGEILSEAKNPITKVKDPITKVMEVVQPGVMLVGATGFELEPICGRERSGSPQAKS